MSQISPDGRFVVSHAQRSRCTWSISRTTVFSRCFIRPRGILAYYDRETGRDQRPAGGRRPALRANRRRVESRRQVPGLCPGRGQGSLSQGPQAGRPTPAIRTRCPIQYDLYRIPFNGGRGGQPEPIAGAVAQRHEQHLPQGLARRPLDRLRPVPQRAVDAARQRALYPADRRAAHRGGCAAIRRG